MTELINVGKAMNRLFIFVLVIAPFLSAQDEYELKDGTIIKGTVISETADETQIETESGEIIIIKVKEDRVGGVYNIELDSGKSIIGQIVFEDTKLIRLDVIGSKPVELSWEDIRNITKAENEDDGTGRIIDNTDQAVINRTHEEHITPGAPIRDIDGNEYQTVEIGSQTWMAENLRVRRYKNGQFIPSHGGTPVADFLYTANPDIPEDEPIASVEAYEDDWDNVDTYGLLYTGRNISNASNSGGVCPDGWDVPTRADFKQLVFYLGGYGIDVRVSESGDMNESHVNSRLAGPRELWPEWEISTSDRFVNLLESPKFGDTGFNAIPAGFRHHTLYDYGGNSPPSGIYRGMGGSGWSDASFWTQTVYGVDDPDNPINENYELLTTPRRDPYWKVLHIFDLTSEANARNVYKYSHINAGRPIRCIMED